MHKRSTDRERDEQREFDQSEISRQLALLQSGVAEIHLVEACTPKHGIVQVDQAKAEFYRKVFQQALHDQRRMVRFVPASGAATRMFAPFIAPDDFSGSVETILEQINDFAFAEDFFTLVSADWDKASYDERLELLKNVLLGEHGLNYNQLPKGAIPFHRYPDGSRTAFEEHLHEAAQLTREGSECEVHFTVPPNFDEAQRLELSQRAREIGSSHQCRLSCTFSEQSPTTDTIALDAQGELFRQENGQLLFRPGGHGALLQNLQSIEADVIFVKNIDNVLPDRLKYHDIASKRMLAGLLLTLKSERDQLLAALEKGAAGALEATQTFASQWFLHKGDALPGGWDAARAFLDRPMRVCGMVRNEGQPGGGPFWLADCKFGTSVQIVERAQLTLDHPEQRAVFEGSTHFNPVDLVCAVNDPAGRPYDLKKFVNPKRVFLADKTFEGRPLKALEHPGLWNGAMEDWLTVFVEVDSATFAPVKTVADLLNPEHRA